MLAGLPNKQEEDHVHSRFADDRTHHSDRGPILLLRRGPDGGSCLPGQVQRYIVSLIGVSSGSASLLVKVLAYLPPTAPFAMPTLVGFGDVTWWQFLFSVVVGVVCAVLVARVALASIAPPCSEPAGGFD